MSDALRNQFETASGISGETLAGAIAASCLLMVMLWMSWIAASSLRQLRDGLLTVGEVGARILWAGLLFCVVVALIAFVE